MFFTTSAFSKRTLLLSTSALILALASPVYADGELAAIDIEGAITEVDDSTVVYGQEFISQQRGMVTAVDLINRIPGGSSFLNNGNGDQRGFSSNDDPILINGQRISGKSNSSRDALSRISVDQVLRVEVIRGSSPDIKISSQGALLNVVIREDASGSGSWQARANYMAEQFSTNLEASYTGKIDFVDYSVSAMIGNFKNIPVRREALFDAVGGAVSARTEHIDRNIREAEISANMSFNLNNGEAINVNALYRVEAFKANGAGDILWPDVGGDLTVEGENVFSETSDENGWEIGLDFDTSIAENWQLKLIGLHSQDTDDNTRSEDYEITDGVIQNDFESTRDIVRSESLTRASVVWSPSTVHRIEVGSELAFNKRESDFTLFNLTDGVLVRDDVASTVVTIKEIRDESFLIHSWQLNEKLSLDSNITYEYSKITQSGNLDKSRSFNYIKPSWDLRYNLTDNDQFQLSARKQVSQLNFRHFASSLNGENKVIGGNENLSPEESWVYQASYEHRLADDMGYIKPSITYEKFANKLSRIPLEDGIAGVGNAGEATRITYGIEGAIRFFFLGLPNLQLSGNLTMKDTEIEDPFTGEMVRMNGQRTTPEGRLKLRHDLPEYGFLWEIDARIHGDFEFRSINDFIVFKEQDNYWVNVAAEKQIMDGLILRVSYDNILGKDFDRERFYYEEGRAGGVLSNVENRTQSFNRQLFVTLKGTF